MQSNEIKEGDGVCLKYTDYLLKMTAGLITEGYAVCYWVKDGEIKHDKIPVSALKPVSED